MSKEELPFKISEPKLKEAKRAVSEGKKGKCCAYSCTNEAIPRKGYLCHKHYARKMRKLKPIKVRYSQMKQKAKERSIPFTITMEEFEKFCHKTGYLVVKGVRGLNATVDRMCNAQGYHIWNISLLSNRANARKGNRGSNGNPFEKPVEEHEDLPF